MPIETRWEPSGFVFLVTGIVSFHEIHTANTDFFEDHRAAHAKYQIVDLRECEEITASPIETTRVAVYDVGQSLTSPHVRVAFVTADARFDAHFADYAASLEGSSWTADIFRDMAKARQWAGAPAEA